MIRVLVVDDHPAVRLGLLRVVRSEPGLVAVDALGTAEQALAEARSRAPDVALIDYQLGADDGLLLGIDLKGLPDPPRVIVYSAFTGPRLALAAAIAGADALLDKAEEVDVLLDTIRSVARGGTRLPRVSAEDAALTSSFDQHDLATIGMAVAGESHETIAGVIGVGTADASQRIRRIVSSLRPETAAHGGFA